MVQARSRHNAPGCATCCESCAILVAPIQYMKSNRVLCLAAGLLLLASVARADTFYVSDFGVNTITEYDENGVGSLFTSEFINGPYGLALDASGNLYVSTNSNVIRKFGPDGADLGVFASTGINFANGLAFDSTGNLYVANFGGNTVQKFAPDGTDLGVFAIVIRPTGLAFDAAGNLYVANIGSTIERFSPNGTPLVPFSSLTLNSPMGLAFDTLGNLYVANSASDTIDKFSPTGIYLGAITGGNLAGPIGLAFDSNGNLYAVNNQTATISVFTPAGTNFIFANTGFSPTFIAVQKAPTALNISTRLNVLTGENVLDGGFIITGFGTKRVLIRGLGPSLSDAGVDGVLADPLIELHSGTTNEIIMSNDNWKNNQRSEIEATGLAPDNDLEAALIRTLEPGAYTVIERGKQATTGIGLIEVYDLGGGFGPELANVSTRGFVDTGSNVMIAGFIVASSTGGSGEIIVRALGPSLGAVGVSNPLADPTLELRDINGALLASNDNWQNDQEAAITATGLAPTNNAEAAILATVTTGAYTAIVAGQGGSTGVGLVEVYNLR